MLEDDKDIDFRKSILSLTESTVLLRSYGNGILVVHQFWLSRQFIDLWDKSNPVGLLRKLSFVSVQLDVKSSVQRSGLIYMAKRLVTRLGRIVSTKLPILTQYEHVPEMRA